MPPHGSNRAGPNDALRGVQRSHATQLKESEPLFDTYEHLSGLPRGDAALTMLRKVASLVKPIMRKRGWHVQVLAEFLPPEQNLLGLNINKGYKICIRLRYHHSPDLFLPLEQVVDTMLHELSHNVWGAHDRNFHALWDELRDEHETLLRKGYTGEGFLSAGHKLGGSGRVPPPHEMRRLARASAEKRRVLTKGSGQRLGGTPVLRGQDVRQVIAEAATRRNQINQINKGCASGTADAGRLSDQSASNTFKTKSEEDDANDRAIEQAIYDLIEQEEERKMNGTFQAAPTDGGLAWSPQNGLYEPKLHSTLAMNDSRTHHPSEEEQLNWALQDSSRSATPELGVQQDPSAVLPQPLAGEPPISTQSKTKSSPNFPQEVQPKAQLASRLGAHTDIQAAKRQRPESRASTRTTKQEPDADHAIDLTSSPVKAEPDTAQWTCSICTCINPLQFLACDACGVERPALAGPATRSKAIPQLSNAVQRAATLSAHMSKETLGWECSRCGAFMEHRWWTCSVCGLMKASS